ncbi:MAG: GNAT family N-acetyltransferase [Atopobiaceae bacterium]|nr:GNAT family N-acetyltransferase [Atopobiaceae bacterium]
MTRHVIVSHDADLDSVWQFYVDVCNHQAVDPYTPLWTLGVYPSKEVIAEHIENGDLYLFTDDKRPVAAMALVPHDDPEYAEVPWPSKATGEEACSVHLLAVHPDVRGQGIGRELVREAIRLARAWDKRAIHLDVVPSNLSAKSMYLAEGFSFVCSWEIWYEDTGTMDFDMYELAL